MNEAFDRHRSIADQLAANITSDLTQGFHRVLTTSGSIAKPSSRSSYRSSGVQEFRSTGVQEFRSREVREDFRRNSCSPGLAVREVQEKDTSARRFPSH